MNIYLTRILLGSYWSQQDTLKQILLNLIKFPGHLTPSRPGVYLREVEGGLFYFSKWDGSEWKLLMNTVKDASEAEATSICQNLTWYALKKEIA